MSHRKDKERAEKGDIFRNSILQKVQNTVEKAKEKLLAKDKSYDELAAIALAGLKKVPAPMSWKRNQVIKGAEQDIREGYRKGLTTQEMLAEMESSPNYCKLLEYVELNFDHIEVLLQDLKPKGIGK